MNIRERDDVKLESMGAFVFLFFVAVVVVVVAVGVVSSGPTREASRQRCRAAGSSSSCVAA